MPPVRRYGPIGMAVSLPPTTTRSLLLLFASVALPPVLRSSFSLFSRACHRPMASQ